VQFTRDSDAAGGQNGCRGSRAAMGSKWVVPVGSRRDDDEEFGAAAVSTTASKPQPPKRVLPTVGAVPLLGATATAAAASTAEPLLSLGPTSVWLLESCIGVGSVKMGLPGVAAQVFFLSPIPTFREIMSSGTTGKLPMLPFSSMLTNGFLWTTYGILNANPAIWAPNVPAFVLGVIYTGIFAKAAPAGANWLPGTVPMHVGGAALSCAAITAAATMLDTPTAITALGWAGTTVVIVMFSGPLAAMKTVIETKSTKSLPFSMTVASFICTSLWTTYGLYLDDFFIWFPNGLGLVSSFVQFGLFAKYGFHKDEPTVTKPDSEEKP